MRPPALVLLALSAAACASKLPVVVADQLSGPVNDLLWHDGALYISQFGRISVLQGSAVRDLVTDLSASFDHQNNQLTVGPDGFVYFGMGTVTNSGVVGLDNAAPSVAALLPGFARRLAGRPRTRVLARRQHAAATRRPSPLHRKLLSPHSQDNRRRGSRGDR